MRAGVFEDVAFVEGDGIHVYAGRGFCRCEEGVGFVLPEVGGGGVGGGGEADGEGCGFVAVFFAAEVGEPVAAVDRVEFAGAGPGGVLEGEASAGVGVVPGVFIRAAVEDGAEGFPVEEVVGGGELGGVALGGFVFELDVEHVPVVVFAEEGGAVDFLAGRGFEHDAVLVGVLTSS